MEVLWETFLDVRSLSETFWLILGARHGFMATLVFIMEDLGIILSGLGESLGGFWDPVKLIWQFLGVPNESQQ